MKTLRRKTDSSFRHLIFVTNSRQWKWAKHSFDIRCNPKEYSLLKTLTARCSEDHNNNFTFIPYELLQITNTETYRRQIIFQNNFTASMTTIPINGGTKTAMIDKKEEKILQVTSISEVEETHL